MEVRQGAEGYWVGRVGRDVWLAPHPERGMLLVEVRGRSGRSGGEYEEGGAAGALSERGARPWGLELRESKSWGDRGVCEGDEGVEAREGARGGAREVWEGRGGVR